MIKTQGLTHIHLAVRVLTALWPSILGSLACRSTLREVTARWPSFGRRKRTTHSHCARRGLKKL